MSSIRQHQRWVIRDSFEENAPRRSPSDTNDPTSAEVLRPRQLLYWVNHQGHRHPPVFSLLKQTQLEDQYLRRAVKSQDSTPVVKHEYIAARYQRWGSPVSNDPVVFSGIKICRGKKRAKPSAAVGPFSPFRAGEDSHDSKRHEDWHSHLPPATAAASKLFPA